MQATLLRTPAPGLHTWEPPLSEFRRNVEAETERLLTQGGDTRIELNAVGANAYGCAPRPDPALVQLGSSTGSVISEAGFQAAVALYKRGACSAGRYRFEIERQRRELASLTGAVRLPGTQVVLAASGTDIHLFATLLAARGERGALRAVMVQPEETGSGVPAALAALHFAAKTSQGCAVKRGVPVADTPLQPPIAVALRHADGSLRSSTEVDAEFSAQVAHFVQTDGRCLLVLTDLSKTGLLAPSPACARQLQQRFGEQLAVLVDACQFRLSSSTLLNYLAQDFMVAITGSKFVGGPAFSGALLLPPGVAQRSRGVPLDVLRNYSSRSDWPEGWPAAQVLQDTINPGLLLRWEAALMELRRFNALSEQKILDFLHEWQQAVSLRISQDASLEAVPVAPLQRGTPSQVQAWDGVQTIFPFLVRKPMGLDGRQVLTKGETDLLFRQMQQVEGFGKSLLQTPNAAGIRFQLGQPVFCGWRDGMPVSALRMCCSARLVTQTLSAGQSVTQAIAQTMLAFDKVAMLAQRLL